MKAIISHDVDHITVFEHKNMIIPKHLIRNCIETMTGHVSVNEFFSRLMLILRNEWNNLESLMEFNRENDIPATFFFGVNNGIGLDYSVNAAKQWISKVDKMGFDVGVHGIFSDSFNNIKAEYDLFKKISGLEEFGIRMHYLRKSNETLNYLSDSGYIFDSSTYKLANPFKIGNMWEFPLHIMDGYLIETNGRWQNQNLHQAIDSSLEKIEEALDLGIEYFTVLFHDRYFSDSFKTWKEWYIWLVSYLTSNNLEIISYRDAIREMEVSGL